jgi:predicted enzyme related to lactoylglutathione lyase
MDIGLFKRMQVVSYNVTDWQQAKNFYGQTLGLPTAGYISDEVGWMEFGDKEGTTLAISLWRGPEPVPPRNGGATVVFEVEDVYETIRELRQRGVRCDDIIAIPNMVTYANFYDPEGNRLQVAGPPPQS